MSFTYAQPKQAIQDFTENTETSFVTNLPVFIRGAEDRICACRPWNCFKMQTSALSSSDPFLLRSIDYLSMLLQNHNCWKPRFFTV